MTQLSAQQLLALEKIKVWHADARRTGWSAPFRLFGAAGTGKTTIAKEIPEALGFEAPAGLYVDAPLTYADARDDGRMAEYSGRGVVYGTYTGKAAHVLRTKGAAPVSTIHSAIYMPTSSLEARMALAAARTRLDEYREELTEALASAEAVPSYAGEAAEMRAAVTELEAQIPALVAAASRMYWEFDPDGPWASASLIVLDEVSMVDAKIAAHIEEYEVPILVLGDPAQLPPVEGGGYYTNARPDMLLTEVHRQALDSPVIELATRVRTSTDSRLGLTTADLTPASVRDAMAHDQVIVWSNPKRWSLISAMRKLSGFPEGIPVAGDKIMCLTNNKDLAVFNGEMFMVLDVAAGTLGPTLTVQGDTGSVRQIPVFSDGFLGRDMQNQAKRSGSGMRGGRMLATFAQAITCHKSQGSEWGSVYVVNQTDDLVSMTTRKEGREAGLAYGRQWLYTAASRAKDKVTITAPRPGR